MPVLIKYGRILLGAIECDWYKTLFSWKPFKFDEVVDEELTIAQKRRFNTYLEFSALKVSISLWLFIAV